ncbi:MAG: caspase family protein, partial [Ktedonobacteraceae bacterium]|nr:caspase family protein [Ktedonobacteraceae bacterium]
MPTQKQPSQEVSSTGKRLALVVGNNGKPEPGRDALKYATQSARDIAEVLQDRCSFELLQPPLLDEPTHTMRDAICDLVENRGADDFLLFYFCGHGEPLFIETEQRDVYLVSQDFNPQRVENTDKGAHISFSWLSRVLYEKTDAGTVLIMLDCCYAGNTGYQQEEQPLEALKQSIQKCFDSYLGKAENSRGVRITIAATSYNGTTFEQDGYSVLACHLLRVLGAEECVGVVNDRGEITFERLVDYLRARLPHQPSISNKPISAPVILATFPDQTVQARRARQQAEQQAAQEQKLRVLSNHEFSRFLLRDRLESFAGRATELNEIRQSITEMGKTGGYVAITGEAGQGKSSIIAKLVDLHRSEQDEQREELVIYHFIPFDAGTDYQVVLLKHLMARLILKYHLPTFYVEGDHLPTLRSLFPSLLKEVVAKGGQEIIFIDGLDQLQEDATAVRDSNFLPSTAPPEGIVFVIGTRPNALRQLKRHTPFEEYPLRPLSQDDFKLILQHRGVLLESHHIAILYSKLEANALFLDLAAKELAEHHTLTVDEIIQRISDNPENLFSLTLERLGRNQPTLDTLWKRVIKPVLVVLLIAHEPIERTHLKQIINLKHTYDAHSSIDSKELERGLERLGGLIIKDIKDGLQSYSLFHLK